MVADDESPDDLLGALADQGTRTSTIARSHALTDVGHLDVVAELCGLPSED